MMVRTQVQLTEPQVRSLRRLSAATGRSIAELIRQGVEHYLNSEAGQNREVQVQRALRIAGKFSSGSADGSKNHDRYLADAYR